MVAAGKRRASGKTGGVEQAELAAEDLECYPDTEVLPEERDRDFTHLSFARMRVDWSGEDRGMVARIHDVVQGRMLEMFSDAYGVMYELWDIVREVDHDENGEARRDRFGSVVYRVRPGGGYYEDWSLLTSRQRENFLYQITSSLFTWEQRSVDLWGEAMFAKAKWVERRSIEFDAPMAGTVQDRDAVADIKSMDERYFGLFLTLLSRKAEALVRAMNGIVRVLSAGTPR